MSSNTQEDLAYVRAMAEEGRNVPLVGGVHFMLWGGIIGTAALISWFDKGGIISLPFNDIWLWTGAVALGWIAGLLMGRRTARAPGATTFGNKTAAAAWFGCGAFITIFWFSILFAEMLGVNGEFPVGYLGMAMFPVVFGLYGLAFLVTSVATNSSWMKWVAYASWAISSALIFSVGTYHFLLLSALGTYAVVFVPGYILVKNQPSTIV